MNDLIPIIAASPLRQRLIDDMTMRRFSRETQRNYIRDVGRFATWLGRSPHTAMAEDLRRFQIEQHEAGVPVPTMNSIVAALRFFFTHTVATGQLPISQPTGECGIQAISLSITRRCLANFPRQHDFAPGMGHRHLSVHPRASIHLRPSPASSESNRVEPRKSNSRRAGARLFVMGGRVMEEIHP